MDKHGQFLSAVLVMMLALIMIAMFSVYAMILEGNGNVYTSLTSSSISSYMAGQIANQYLNIMPFSLSVNNTFSGMLKNFIAGYYPSYVLADSLLNYTNLTYDYAMPPNVTVPNSVEAYVSVILNNTQSSPTPAPFQQMINVPNTTSFWNYINTTSGYFGQNVEFFYGNGKTIPSWLESYNSSSGRWWIKIGTISASSVTKIYMGFASKTTNLFNTKDVGEAPQISSTYAEYDDGANIFNNYWNFAGTSLPSGLTAFGYPSTVNNGFIPTTGNGPSYVYTSVSSSLIGEMGASADVSIIGFTNSIPSFSTDYYPGSGTYAFYTGYMGYYQPGQTGNIFYSTSSSITSIASPVPTTSFYVSGFYWQTGHQEWWTNYESISATNSLISAPPTDYLVMGSDEGWTAYWLRTRAYPPNGVMPSVTFSSVV